MTAARVTRVAKLENRWSQDQLVAGIPLGGWLRILARHRFGVSPAYLHRVLSITALSLPSTLLGALETLLYRRRIAAQAIDPVPLFIVGHWRSGTTHLHNLIGRDPRHTFCTIYQAVFPNHFLLTGRIGPRLLRGTLPETRSYDAVKQGWNEEAEDEIALIKLTKGLSFYGALMFPDAAESYERYVDFHDATPEERRRWGDAFVWFLKKMMVATGGKRVIVKSCPHSARIPMLLERFPDARFVHIHRHPARVFASMLHMRQKVDWENFLQRPTEAFVHDRRELTARLGERVFTRLAEDRALIPEGHLVEIGYDELCGHEMDRARDLYERLDLGGWDAYEPQLQAYVDGLKGYQRNRLPLEAEFVDYVYDRWRLVYDTWGYPREPDGHV